MNVKCPVCQAEYDLEPGKYKCECGAKFFVKGPDGVAETDAPADDDLNKTIAPKRHVDFDPADDRTMPGRRDRQSDGRFCVGDVIMGRYKILSELGQGGMGVVYKCFDETAGVVIALKALPPELSHDTLEMEDIKANFQLVARLVHQNIAISKNLEYDNSNGNYYLIMEYVAGEDLRSWIRHKRRDDTLNLESVLPVIRQVAEALDYAHEQKIIHRDIKPGNIMIDSEGQVKVLDFGLAAQIHTSMTRVSMAYHGTSGTGPYMAPEQWRGRAQGAAADQYALAAMTYEMLAGHLPFEGSDPTILREAVLNDTPEELKNMPGCVRTAVTRAMSKEPTERFASCVDFVAAMEGKKFSGSKTKSGNYMWMVVVAVIVLAELAGFYYGHYRHAEAKHIAEEKNTAKQKRLAEEKHQREAEQDARREREQRSSSDVEISSTTDLYNFNSMIFYAPLENKASQLPTGQRITTHGNVSYTEVDGIKCAYFDGKSMLSFGQNHILGNSPCTMCIWEYSTSNNADIGAAFFIGKQGVRSKRSLIRHENRLEFDSYHGGNLVHLSLPPKKWNFIACTSDRNGVKLFVNGQLVSSFLHNLHTQEGHISIGGIFDENDDLEHPWKGYLSHARIYNRCLSPQEISQLAAELTPGSENTYSTQRSNEDFTKIITLPGGTTIEMVKVQAGTFEMSAKGGGEVLRSVTLKKDFYIGKTEVTQAQWIAVMGYNPSKFKGRDLPVEMVSWLEAREFCDKLNQNGKAPAGYKFTLPTEAQWEYAAHGGKMSKGFKYSGSNNVDDVAWYSGNSGRQTHRVGTKKPNELGLYNMCGNVWEWCIGDWNSNRENQDISRSSAGAGRVHRGGSWMDTESYCRCSGRSGGDFGLRSGNLGFRLALVSDDAQKTVQVKNKNFPEMISLPNGTKIEMVKINAGSFIMGSPEGELGGSSLETPHRVKLTHDYWLGKYEVTQGQYRAVMGNNPSTFKKGDNYPVEKVSWVDAKKFCDKLNEHYAGKLPHGYRFDLPTEAQWEYACRAGTTTALYNGSNLTSKDGYCSNLNSLGWYGKNSGHSTHEVGGKAPNSWGLYDMYGNVEEWCRDWFGTYGGNATDPIGPVTGSMRIFRGGSWRDRASCCRSASRDNYIPSWRAYYLGFRLALVFDNEQKTLQAGNTNSSKVISLSRTTEITVQGDNETVWFPGTLFKPPYTIRAKCKTNKYNIRVLFLHGEIIFNWELDPYDLRLDIPGISSPRNSRGNGFVGINTLANIEVKVFPTSFFVYVNGKLRYSGSGNWQNVESQVGIKTALGHPRRRYNNIVTIKEFSVEPGG